MRGNRLPALYTDRKARAVIARSGTDRKARAVIAQPRSL